MTDFVGTGLPSLSDLSRSRMLPRLPDGRWQTLEGTGEKMTRYRDITPAEMTPAQRRVHHLIIAGRRWRFGGPFQLLIRAPEICEDAAKLGEHLRWGTTLPDRLSELAIITTARFWRAQYEWFAHAPLAEKAGVPAGAVEAIRCNETPNFVEKDEMLVHRSASSCSRRNGYRMQRSTRLMR